MPTNYLAALSKRPTEMVKIEGVEIEIRGLSLGEARELEKQYQDSLRGLAVIVRSCFIDGKQAFTMETLQDVMPKYVQQLDEAIGRVNSFSPGNSKATAQGDSSSG